MVFLQISLGMYYFVKYFFGNMLFFKKKTHQNLSIFVKMVELVLDFANECWWYNNDELLNTSYFLFFSTCSNIGVQIIFLCVYIVGLSLIHWNSCWLVLSQLNDSWVYEILLRWNWNWSLSLPITNHFHINSTHSH